MQQVRNYFQKTRVETFSDGIFAIIITVLVLELKVPVIKDVTNRAELLNGLWLLMPKIISWIISFLTVSVMWVNHHRLFKMFKVFNNGLFWGNALLLLAVSFTPFPTAVLGDYHHNETAVLFYGFSMALCNGMFSAVQIYAFMHPVILDPDIDVPRFKRKTIYSIAFGPLLYIAGALLSFVDPVISFVTYFCIPIYFIFPHAIEELELKKEA